MTRSVEFTPLNSSAAVWTPSGCPAVTGVVTAPQTESSAPRNCTLPLFQKQCQPDAITISCTPGD